MKIAEMIKKIEAYNETAELIDTEKVELMFYVRFGAYGKVGSMKEFRKFIRQQYIDEMADAILNYDGYAFKTLARIETTDRMGDDIHEEIEFYAE
jgi:wyosine [tRNA(Phe)-imidazoG37] synthetase (radical SAM superfamily)